MLFSGKADAKTIVFAYFLETIIIGLVHVIKIITIIISNKEPFYKYTSVPFFIFHYGTFVAVQLIFVFVFLKSSDSNIKAPFRLIENISYVLSFRGMLYILLSLILYSLADYYFNFISTKTYKKETVDNIFIQPYKRIFIQQFAVILAGFFMILSSGVIAVAILIIVIRTLIELSFVVNPNSTLLNYKYKKRGV